MLMGPSTTGGGVVQEMTLFAPAPSIYGGSDEIQKNIIGERGLGLAKEAFVAVNGRGEAIP
jgi:alkylation response protein AidB-like acyl-CoA dehydrogenase